MAAATAATTTTIAGKLAAFLRSRPGSPGRSPDGSPVGAGSARQDGQPATLDDVLQHFARRGLDATPKLYHCRTAAGGDGTQLDVVRRASLPASYATVSATGIVQVPGGGAPSVHTRVGEWLRHASLHELFASLAAGGQLLEGCVLQRWAAAARRQRFERRRQQLGRQLLQLKPAYHRLLSELRAKLAAVQSGGGALQAMEAGPFRLETLVAQQQEYQQSKLAPLLARTTAGVVADMEQMAQRLQSSERMLRRELHEQAADPSAGAMHGLCPIKIRAERAAVAAKHAAALDDLQRLPAFLRLLAALVMQAQLDLLLGAVAGLRAHLQAAGNALQVDLQLLASGTVGLSPSLEDTLKGLSKGVVEHLVRVLTAAPRPLNHPSLAALLADPVEACVGPAQRAGSMAGGRLSAVSAAGAAAPGMRASRCSVVSCDKASALRAAAAAAAAAVSLPWLGCDQEDVQREGGQLLLMVVSDKGLQDLRRSLDQHIMRSYREAATLAEGLAELCVLRKFASTWDAKAYKARQHSVAGLRRDAQLLREWQAQLQAVLDRQCVSLVLETAALKASLSRTLASASATVAMLLVVAARRAAEAGIARMQALSRELNHQPSKLPDFICFKQAVRAISHGPAATELLAVLPGQVRDLHAAVAAAGCRLPHADQVLLDDLRDASRGFGASLTAAGAFVESRLAGMCAAVERQAKEVLAQAQALLRVLEAASMAHRLRGEAPSADDTRAWGATLTQLADAAAVLLQQQAQLGMRATSFADLDEAQRCHEELLASRSVAAAEAEA